MERFELYTDEAIVAEAQGGDSDAMDYILVKFKNLVRARAHSYFLVGADHEDIVQEGMIGLYKAVRDYRADRNASFKAFADLCVTRQIITAVKTATRQKHIPLNYYISLNRPAYDGDSDRTLMEALKEDDRSNPEALLITREDISAVKERMDTLLSPLEMDALTGYLQGKSYQEISDKYGHHVKSIDNALQRVKKKLMKYMESRK
ncbi:MAG: RNA polymerase sporulation sigma factor SigH [Clostridia bacterium]|jgi:RNA polymerase sporulation-specific sigma factor|nr:RNA polymerase sporulation sigma factor SigH [Clostridia bacterium]MBR5379722.1 RNA polymerase sporulation sigma factor SigH [Clostridia bacterium]MBR5751802.1 RNA polymerase sporulation sigma factor SigH [Clostridia bacterium]